VLAVSDLVAGTYVFRLTVTNEQGGSAYDDINVFVKEPEPPIVDAGSDKRVMLPSDTVTISGTATDSDGSIASYRWVQTSGAACAMTHATSSSLNVSGLRSGSYRFRLTVSDNAGLTGYDDVSVDVTLPSVADGTPDQSVGLLPASVVTDVLSPHDSRHDNAEAILGELTSHDLENCHVRIFDGSGKCLYSGVWTSEKYSEIFSESGLYIYNIIKRGRRIDAGKICVMH